MNLNWDPLKSPTKVEPAPLTDVSHLWKQFSQFSGVSSMQQCVRMEKSVDSVWIGWNYFFFLKTFISGQNSLWLLSNGKHIEIRCVHSLNVIKLQTHRVPQLDKYWLQYFETLRKIGESDFRWARMTLRSVLISVSLYHLGVRWYKRNSCLARQW